MAEHPQNRDAQAQATSASQIRPNENTSERTAWRPLRLPMFRNLLIADLVSDIGTFMQGVGAAWLLVSQGAGPLLVALTQTASALPDRKSTRLNSSHVAISYAVFCLKK